MSATRLVFPTLFAVVLGLSAAFGISSQRASAEVVGAKVPPTLAAAIRADVEARGYQYGGDCKFDSMYLAPGMWCSFVISVSGTGAEVSYGRFASDEIVKVNFTREGESRWVNPSSGIGTPARVPLLSARQGPKPDSWIVSGVDFGSNQEIAIFDASGCGGEQRCPTDHRVAIAKAGTNGAFEITVQLDPAANPVPGQVNRLLQATGGAFIQVAYHHAGTGTAPTPPVTVVPPTSVPPTSTPPTQAPPTQQPGTPANPTPAVPDTGDGGDSSDGPSIAVFASAALLGLAAAGTVGAIIVKRRK